MLPGSAGSFGLRAIMRLSPKHPLIERWPHALDPPTEQHANGCYFGLCTLSFLTCLLPPPSPPCPSLIALSLFPSLAHLFFTKMSEAALYLGRGCGSTALCSWARTP